MIGILVPSEYVGGGFTGDPSDGGRGGYLAKLFATFSTSSTSSATCTNLTSLYFGSQQMCAFAMTCRVPVSIFSKRQMTAMSLRISTRLNMSSVFLKSGRCIATVLNSRGCCSTSWYLQYLSGYYMVRPFVGYVLGLIEENRTSVYQPAIRLVHCLVARLGIIHSFVSGSSELGDKILLVLRGL